MREEEQEVMCPLLRGPCVREKCLIWQLIPEGEECPVSLEEDSLEAIKQALSESAKYADEILGIDKESGKDLLQQIGESVRSGKIDLRRILADVLNVD